LVFLDLVAIGRTGVKLAIVERISRNKRSVWALRDVRGTSHAAAIFLIFLDLVAWARLKRAVVERISGNE